MMKTLINTVMTTDSRSKSGMTTDRSSVMTTDSRSKSGMTTDCSSAMTTDSRSKSGMTTDRLSAMTTDSRSKSGMTTYRLSVISTDRREWRNLIKTFLLLLLAAVPVSCMKEQEAPGEARQVTVSIEDAQVKTAFNSAHTSILWEEGDCIGIFHNAGEDSMQNGELEYRASEQMSVTVPTLADRLFGVYPYDESMGTSPSQASVTVSAAQTQTHPGQFNGEHYPLASSGNISDGNVRLEFSPLAAMIAFNIYSTTSDGSESVKSVTVTPTRNSNYAGVQKVDLTSSSPAFTAGSLSSGITLTVENPLPLDSSRPANDKLKSYEKQLHMTLARQSYTYINIEVTTTAGKSYTMQTNATAIDCAEDDITLLNINLATRTVKKVLFAGTEELVEVKEADITGLAFEDVTIEGNMPQAAEMTCPQDMDFSRVGYHWGDDPIPSYPQYGQTLYPTGGDDYQMIQNAIDNFPEGSKGAIVLGEGTFNISQGLSVNKSGLVLRGTKEGDALKTTIYKTGTDTGDIVTLGSKAGSYSKAINWSCAGKILGSHTPVGLMWVDVDNADLFNPGDRVCICRYPNQKWINDLQMDGLQFPWEPNAFFTAWDRYVIKVEGSRVYLDNPVVMAIDEVYGGGYLAKYNVTGCISESGVEDLILDCQYDASEIENSYDTFYFDVEIDENHAHTAVKLAGCEHCWVTNVESHHVYFSCVQFGTACTHCTALSCRYLEPVSLIQGSRRYAFSMGNGELCLVKNCHADLARHSYITTGDNRGPNVFTQSSGTNSFAESGPHNKWSTGTLYDHLKLTGLHSYEKVTATPKMTPGTEFKGSNDRYFGLLRIQDAYNFGATDSQGWTGANLVFWNCESEIYVCENPWVTSQNWAWGCTGSHKVESNSKRNTDVIRNTGNIYSDGEHIILDGYTSLYEYQLNKRHSEGIRYFIPGFNYNN